ncbi:hypothetical protein [Rhizobium leguminosarum]|uniref:hypothetical protein n=1 Tax=Rhizobium leguminosarum TaxID=384 RepID=UPI001AE1E2FD|nr:hypothetical protein [Rhizobium leguminosarum]MBP2448086.1 hypothetical protein [Rhizobium leguminosarum]
MAETAGNSFWKPASVVGEFFVAGYQRLRRVNANHRASKAGRGKAARRHLRISR